MLKNAYGLLGGISFFANRYGWACDNVLSYDIVLPDTSVESVTLSSNPSLYRSLRGAGASNFGIVISFTLEAFVQPNPGGIWTGSKLFPWDKVPERLRLDYKLTTDSMDVDPDLSILNMITYMQAYDVLWGMDIYTHMTHPNASTWPEHLQPYEALEGVPSSTEIGIEPLSVITGGLVSLPGARNMFGTFTYHPSVELEQKITELFHAEVISVKNMSEFLPTGIMQPISRTAIKEMNKRGGNALGIAEQGPLRIFTISWQWKDPSDDNRSYAAYHRFMDSAEAAAKETGVWHPYKYINYAEMGQDVWAGYGEESLAELRRVQRDVDPDGVFAKGGLGGGFFKLNDLPLKEKHKHKKAHAGDGVAASSLKSEL